MKALLDLFKKDVLLSILILISLLSLLRSTIIPLRGDEITYAKIAENILNGRYYLSQQPSSVSPVMPFLIAFCYTYFNPALGFILAKLMNVVFVIFGFRYLYKFLKNQSLSIPVISGLILLTITNTHSIAWFSSLYPESILFFALWGFIYFYSKPLHSSNFKKMLLFFLLLLLTRYVFAVLGLLVLFYYYRCCKSNLITHKQLKLMLFYGVILASPVLFWFKYVYLIEQGNLSEISYFERFKQDSGLKTNLLSGLGIEKHPEVSRINGIPAFVSLFLPVTGLRHFASSLILILIFLYGYLKHPRAHGITVAFYASILIMLGLILAGTGFSRYWLVLLPCFYLGFYFVYKNFKLDDALFLKIAKLIAVIYVINELRLDYLILVEYL